MARREHLCALCFKIILLKIVNARVIFPATECDYDALVLFLGLEKIKL